MWTCVGAMKRLVSIYYYIFFFQMRLIKKLLITKIRDKMELINFDWGSTIHTNGCPTDQLWHTIQNQQFCN